MKDVLEGMPEPLKHLFADIMQKAGGEEEHDIESCKKHGCPALVKYDSIEHESKEGVMFNCNNLLVWISADKLEFNREDKEFELCLGEAKGRDLI